MIVGIAVLCFGLVAVFGGHGDRGIVGGALLIAGGGGFFGYSVFGVFYFRRRS